jgi:hypothetical protein
MVYRKWASVLSIPDEISERIGLILERVLDKYGDIEARTSNRILSTEEIEELDRINLMLSEVIGEFIKEFGALREEMLVKILVAINLYQFLNVVEEKITEIDREEAEKLLNKDLSELEEFMKTCTSILHSSLFHPLTKTAWESMELQLRLYFREILRDMINIKIFYFKDKSIL